MGAVFCIRFMNLMQIDTPFGPMVLAEEGEQLTHLYLKAAWAAQQPQRPTPLLRRAERELQEYFARQRRQFDLPLAPQGTPFQQSVWQALRQIPYGQTASYKQIAQTLGHPTACRAVGGANNKNPLPIFIPCHRVIGAGGSLTGYAGGLDLKQGLLALEAKYP